tara:strand:- start:92 stop:487 length:396 start_codon:yes stop_codon:yes gene_type:complete
MYKQLSKYFTIGVLGTLINLSVLYVLVEWLNFYYLFAAALAYILAITNNFFWNKKWTFKNKANEYKKQYTKYFTVGIFGFLTNLLLLTFFVEILHLWYFLAQIFSIAISGTGTFLSNKYWTFSKNISTTTK